MVLASSIEMHERCGCDDQKSNESEEKEARPTAV